MEPDLFGTADDYFKAFQALDWRDQLAKLVRARGTDRFPLLVFDVAPPSGRAWPDKLPSCQGLRDFYGLCDGGPWSGGHRATVSGVAAIPSPRHGRPHRAPPGSPRWLAGWRPAP